MVAEKFQIYSVKIAGKYICELKNWICSFLLMPPIKTLPQADTYSSRTALSEDTFSLAERARGEDYGVKKITKLKPMRVLVRSFYKFTIFATFTFSVYVLLCHNLASSMLKCEGPLA